MRVELVHHLARARDYQPRPEFLQLCEWWRRGGGGVCALVGIGGSGKTALADRFLNVLPGVMPDDPTGEIQKDASLPQPANLFAFSFYQAPSSESFFGRLYAWLSNEPYDENRPAVPYSRVLQAASNTSALLILDGFEKMQDEGFRGGILGSITDRSMQDFVWRLAEGYLRQWQAIVTTRTDLDDLEYRRSPYYQALPIDRISVGACRALLRQRGVKLGADGDLDRLAERCGYHALTVDLAGGYIAAFGNGDVFTPIEFSSPTRLAAAATSRMDRRQRLLAEQAARLQSIVDGYRGALSQGDPASLALLERICLFRQGVDIPTLASIFLGAEKSGISGAALAELSEAEIGEKLLLLSGMRLLELQDSFRYTTHPAIRQAFLNAFGGEAAASNHDAIRRVLLDRVPENRRTLADPIAIESIGWPQDVGTLDLLEEIVHHTIQAHHEEEAWDIYWDRMGNWKNLGQTLGAADRGERICREFAAGRPAEEAPLADALSLPRRALHISEWGLYLEVSGRLSAAASCFERNIAIRKSMEAWPHVAHGSYSLSITRRLQGHLADSLAAARDAVKFDYPAFEVVPLSGLAHILFLRGEMDEAEKLFRHAEMKQHGMEGVRDPLYGLNGNFYAAFLLAAGRSQEARVLTLRNLEICEKEWGPENDDAPRSNLILGHLALNGPKPERALDFAALVEEWARARNARAFLCELAILRARVFLLEARQAVQQAQTAAAVDRARKTLDEALLTARDCGYGLLHIEVRVLRAEIFLAAGLPADAEADARCALETGEPTVPGSSRPALPAATDPACGYRWGEAGARFALAEALLLTAAQRLARNRLQPGELERPPEEVAAPMDAARRELTTALSLQKAVRDVRAKRTAQRLRKLESGVLTEYPLRQIQTHAAAPLPEVQIMKPPVDFVIVTALDEEREALLRCLPKPFLIPPSHADIRTYFGCEIAAQMSDRSTVTYKVVTLSLPNKGRVEAATATSHAIARWSPRYVLLVGIAGGVSAWGVKLGDILISDQVVDYELQKLTQNGPEVRWQVHRTDPRLLDFARAFTQRDWGDGVAAGRPKEGQPKVHFGPIATGDKVIASDLLQQYRKSDVWPTLIGVEMEAGGAAAAAFQAAEQPGFFMVRGVSDLADGNKDKRSTAAWRQYACLAPAAFTVALLGAAPVPAARVAEVKLEKA